MTTETTEALVDQLVEEFKGLIDDRLGLDAKVLKSLEERVGLIEQSRRMIFCGPRDPSSKYFHGDCVQRSSSLYVCLSDTLETPGTSSAWRRIATDRS